MPPRVRPPYQGTALDPFMRGAQQSAHEGLLNEPETFGIGFALIPDLVDQMGRLKGWEMRRFYSIPEALLWMNTLVGQLAGRYVYIAVFTRMSEAPLMELVGDGRLTNVDLVNTLIPRVPAHWASSTR